MNMNIGHLFERLEIDPKTLPVEFWQQAHDAASKSNALAEVTPAQIRSIGEWIGFRPELVTACFDAAQEIFACAEAEELLRTARYLILELYSDKRINETSWPMPCPSRWRSPSMFYVVLFLSCVPHLQTLHRQRGIPEFATRDILLDLESKIDIFIRRNGYPGLGTYRWFLEHFNNQIFHLGRLQFQFASFWSALNVFKHVSEDKLVIFALADQKFRSDGQYFDADRQQASEDSIRTTRLIDDGTWIRGTPITARGNASSSEIRLHKNEWVSVLKQGDPVLNIHISANTSRNGPLTREACADSFKQAFDFFPRYFPEFTFKGFMCQTWMLDVQLSDLLPASSHIVEFQDWYHLYPFPAASDAGIIEFVFGNPFPGWDTVVPKTSLQEIAVRHVRTGHHWRVTSGLCLNEEILRGKKYTLISE
jgi:hypothetical protein